MILVDINEKDLDFNSFIFDSSYTIEDTESNKLINFESEMQNRIIGQEHAIRSVVGAVKRSTFGLNIKEKPIGSYLFLGPTGVGKTETAKILAETMFEDEEALIRFDMSEYNDKYTISKLIGTTAGYVGYDQDGLLTQRIRENPKSVVLFDEIEKADPRIMDLFLQVLDDGHLCDSKGQFVSFKETIIILTSNVGSKEIFDFIKSKTVLTDKLLDELKKKVLKKLTDRFRPEFLNRLDEIIVYNPLDINAISIILKNQLEEKKFLLEDKLNISLEIDNNVIDFLVKKAFNISFGARNVTRALQSDFETPLIDCLLQYNDKHILGMKVTATKNRLHFIPSFG